MSTAAPSGAPSGASNNITIGGDPVVNQFEFRINQIMSQSNDSGGAFLKGSALGRARETALHNLQSVKSQIVGAKITSNSEVARLELLLKEMESRIRGEDPKAAMNRYGGTKISAKDFDPDDAGSPFDKLKDEYEVDGSGNIIEEDEVHPTTLRLTGRKIKKIKKKGIETELVELVTDAEYKQAKIFEYEAEMTKQDELKKFYEDQNAVLGTLQGAGWDRVQEKIEKYEELANEQVGDFSQMKMTQEQSIQDIDEQIRTVPSIYQNEENQLIDRIKRLQLAEARAKSNDQRSVITGNINSAFERLKAITNAIFSKQEELRAEKNKTRNKLIEIQQQESIAKLKRDGYAKTIERLQSTLKISEAQDLELRTEFIVKNNGKNGARVRFDPDNATKKQVIGLSDALGYVPKPGFVDHPADIDKWIMENKVKIVDCINEKGRLDGLRKQVEGEYKSAQEKKNLLKDRYEKAFNKHYGGKDKAMIEAVRGDLYATEAELAAMKARQEGLRVLLSDDETTGVIIDRINQISHNSRHDTIGGSLGSVVTSAAEGIGRLFGSGNTIRNAFNRGKNGTP